MAEWFKAHAWKACEESPPQVRILFSTPLGKFLRFCRLADFVLRSTLALEIFLFTKMLSHLL